MSPSLPAWDLLTDSQGEIETINKNEVVSEQEDQKEFISYQLHQNRMRLYLGAAILLPFLVISLVWHSTGKLLDLRLLFAVCLPAILYYMYVQNTARRIIYSRIAQMQGWIYIWLPDSIRWKALATAFPRVFAQGNELKYVSDQFWGSVENQGMTIHFWMGNFSYSIQRGKNIQSFIKTVYAFPLGKLVQSDFYLTPHTLMGEDLSQLLSNEDIQTEWVEFNKIFSIEYNGMRSVDGPGIFQTLNPIVQEKIMNLHAQQGKFSLLFSGQTLLMVTDERSSSIHTNFFLNVAIDPRDQEELLAVLRPTIALAGEISPYIN